METRDERSKGQTSLRAAASDCESQTREGDRGCWALERNGMEWVRAKGGERKGEGPLASRNFLLLPVGIPEDWVALPAPPSRPNNFIPH